MSHAPAVLNTLIDTSIFQVTISRIVMAAPGMLVLPIIMERMEKKPWFKNRPALHGPFQVLKYYSASKFPIFIAILF